jgi:hypothetical protein
LLPSFVRAVIGSQEEARSRNAQAHLSPSHK